MAISKAKKEELLAGYREKLSRSQAAYLTDYRGLTVAEITQLRRKLGEVGSTYTVVKNTLAKSALKEAELPMLEDMLDGPVAIGFCFEDVVGPTKVLTDFAKEYKTFVIKGGLVDGKEVSADQIKAMADLPSREVILAWLVAAVQGPMSSLVTTLTAPLRDLAYVLQARADQIQEAAEQPAG